MFQILCFQEVQATHLQSFYSKFEEIGYYGIFKQKTGHRQDGCAIYFKKSLFDLKEHISVSLYSTFISNILRRKTNDSIFVLYNEYHCLERKDLEENIKHCSKYFPHHVLLKFPISYQLHTIRKFYRYLKISLHFQMLAQSYHCRTADLISLFLSCMYLSDF